VDCASAAAGTAADARLPCLTKSRRVMTIRKAP
jgi:hypothetical protein